jgi:hypothetical protein
MDIKELQKNFYYTKTKDGGLGLTNLHDRYPVGNLVNLAHLDTSEIREKVKYEIDDLTIKRRVVTEKSGKDHSIIVVGMKITR